MPRSNSVIAALCLLVALAALGISYEVSHLFRSGNVVFAQQIGPSHRKTILGSAPNDSPVTVRGGSAEALTADAWTQPDAANHPWVWEDTNTPTTRIVIEGKYNGTYAVYTTSTQISQNWTMTLYFRDKNDNPDTSDNNYLTICTYLSSYSCSNTGTFSGNALYLVAVSQNPKQFHLDLSNTAAGDTTIDGYSLLRFDVRTCGSDGGTHTRCNHLKEIDVAGTGATIAGTSSSFDTSYKCPAGGCDIGISK